jgi:hypothetical protein
MNNYSEEYCNYIYYNLLTRLRRNPIEYRPTFLEDLLDTKKCDIHYDLSELRNYYTVSLGEERINRLIQYNKLQPDMESLLQKEKDLKEYRRTIKLLKKITERELAKSLPLSDRIENYVTNKMFKMYEPDV